MCSDTKDVCHVIAVASNKDTRSHCSRGAICWLARCVWTVLWPVMCECCVLRICVTVRACMRSMVGAFVCLRVLCARIWVYAFFVSLPR